jgi:hypothetical protein
MASLKLGSFRNYPNHAMPDMALLRHRTSRIQQAWHVAGAMLDARRRKTTQPTPVGSSPRSRRAKMPSLVETPAWRALAAHHDSIKNTHLRSMFHADPGRAERFSAEGAGLYLDYSKNRVTDETLHLLLDLAEAREVIQRVDAMFADKKVNVTEGRAALDNAASKTSRPD